MTILKVAGLTKRFGATDVLRGIDLEVARGERIAILGASGSGKSTLLRCLNFMERPGGGTIALDGQVLGREGKAGERTYRESELIQVRQRVGMVFQQFNLFPHMTAIGNVMEGLRTVRGMPRPEAEARARTELHGSALPRRRTPIPRISRAARSSGSPSPARSPWTPSCCCSTSPPRRSIPSWSVKS